MSHIFISYSKKNRNYARPLADHLLSLGFDVWIDDEIQPSEDWWRNIRAAIKDCAAFILVMTPEAENSRWVNLELLYCLELGKPLFPLLLDGNPNLLQSDSWSRFADIQVTDARNRKLPSERFYDGLIRRGVQRKSQMGDDVTPSTDSKRSSVGITGDLEAKLIRKADKVQPQSAENSLPDVAVLTAATLSILPPPFDWCFVPAGEVLIEYGDWQSDDGNYVTKRREPSSTQHVFYISKYPITNAQYKVFVDDPYGYRNNLWWNYSIEGQTWRSKNDHSLALNYLDDDVPRTNVNWYEAMAFCFWLKKKLVPILGNTTLDILLPSEEQWQFAAQGSDQRKYPWGNSPNSEYCNIRESMNGQLTSVTRSSEGASPFGLIDVVGNAWEWCLNQDGISEVTIKGGASRILRGGSFNTFEGGATCVSRIANPPSMQDNKMGFRITAKNPNSK